MENNFLYQSENQGYSRTHNNGQFLLPAPNRNLILTFGILSIPCCCCLDGIAGVVFAIIAIILAKKSKKAVNANVEAYDQTTLKKVVTGRNCAIIGLIFSALMLIAALIAIIIASNNGFGSSLISYEGIWNQIGY